MRSLILVLVALLVGCAPATVTVPVLESATQVAVPQPAAIKTSPVHWTIMDRAAIEALAADLAKNPDKVLILYTLDTANFKALTLNLNELRRYIEQQKTALNFAIGVIEQNNKPAASAQK